MTSPVRYGAGGNEETKLTRQSRNALSESNSNLYPIGWVRTLQPLEDTSCGGGWANQPYNASAVDNQYYTQTPNSEQKWRETRSKREKRFVYVYRLIRMPVVVAVVLRIKLIRECTCSNAVWYEIISTFVLQYINNISTFVRKYNNVYYYVQYV